MTLFGVPSNLRLAKTLEWVRWMRILLVALAEASLLISSLLVGREGTSLAQRLAPQALQSKAVPQSGEPSQEGEEDTEVANRTPSAFTTSRITNTTSPEGVCSKDDVEMWLWSRKWEQTFMVPVMWNLLYADQMDHYSSTISSPKESKQAEGSFDAVYGGKSSAACPMETQYAEYKESWFGSGTYNYGKGRGSEGASTCDRDSRGQRWQRSQGRERCWIEFQQWLRPCSAVYCHLEGIGGCSNSGDESSSREDDIYNPKAQTYAFPSFKSGESEKSNTSLGREDHLTRHRVDQVQAACREQGHCATRQLCSPEDRSCGAVQAEEGAASSTSNGSEADGLQCRVTHGDSGCGQIGGPLLGSRCGCRGDQRRRRRGSPCTTSQTTKDGGNRQVGNQEGHLCGNSKMGFRYRSVELSLHLAPYFKAAQREMHYRNETHMWTILCWNHSGTMQGLEEWPDTYGTVYEGLWDSEDLRGQSWIGVDSILVHVPYFPPGKAYNRNGSLSWQGTNRFDWGEASKYAVYFPMLGQAYRSFGMLCEGSVFDKIFECEHFALALGAVLFLVWLGSLLWALPVILWPASIWSDGERTPPYPRRMKRIRGRRCCLRSRYKGSCWHVKEVMINYLLIWNLGLSIVCGAMTGIEEPEGRSEEGRSNESGMNYGDNARGHALCSNDTGFYGTERTSITGMNHGIVAGVSTRSHRFCSAAPSWMRTTLYRQNGTYTLWDGAGVLTRSHRFRSPFPQGYDDFEELTFMQKPAARSIVRLWALQWESRFGLHRHSWSHLEASALDKLHVPEGREKLLAFKAISSKENKEFLLYDTWIQVPIFLEISCITSEHRGAYSWDHHPRVNTPFAFVMGLCDDAREGPDWTCWGEDIAWGAHMDCGTEIVAYAGMHLKVYQRCLAPISDSESTGEQTNGTTQTANEESDWDETFVREDPAPTQDSQFECDSFEEGDETGFSQAQMTHSLPEETMQDAPTQRRRNLEHLQRNAQWLTHTLTNRPAVRSAEIWHVLRNEIEGTTSTTQLRFETPRFEWQQAAQRIEESWELEGLPWSLKEVRDELLYIAKRAKVLMLLIPHEHHRVHTGFVEVVNCLHDGIQTTTKVKTFNVQITEDEIYHALGLFSCMEENVCDILVDSHDFAPLLSLPRGFTMQVIVRGGEAGQQMITPWVMLPFAYRTSFTIWRVRSPIGSNHIECFMERWHHWNNLYKLVEFEWKELRGRRWWTSDVDVSVHGTAQFHDYDKVLVVSYNHATRSMMSVLTMLEWIGFQERSAEAETRVFHFPPSQTRETIVQQIVPEVDCDTTTTSCIITRNGHELGFYESARLAHGDFIYVTVTRKAVCNDEGFHQISTRMENDDGALFQTHWVNSGLVGDSLGPEDALCESKDNSRQMRETLQDVRQRQRRDRQAYRDFVQQFDQIGGHRYLMPEMEGQALGHRGLRAMLMLHGLAPNNIGNKVLRVNIGEIADHLDVMILIREAWRDQMGNTQSVKSEYVVDQPPPSFTRGEDFIHVICDLRPNVAGTPVLIAVHIVELDGSDSYELTPYRVDQRISCDTLFIITGWHAVCEQAWCRCLHEYYDWPFGIFVDSVDGRRYDVEIEISCSSDEDATTNRSDVALDRGRDDHEILDETSLVQTEEPLRKGRRFCTNPEDTQWIYAYVLRRTQPMRLWRGAAGGMPIRKFIATQIGPHERVLPEDLRVYKVFPQPDDFSSVETYIASRTLDVGIQFSLTLVLVEWKVQESSGTGTTPGTTEVWKSVKRVDFQTDRSGIIEQIGMTPWCTRDDHPCDLAVRGRIWPPTETGLRRIIDGDLVRIEVRVPWPRIPLLSQWRMVQDGCPIGEIPTRIRNAPQGGESNENASPASNGTILYTHDPENEENALMQRRVRSAWFYSYRVGTDEPDADKLEGEQIDAPRRFIDQALRNRDPAWRSNPGRIFYVTPQPADLVRERITGLLLADTRSMDKQTTMVMIDVEIMHGEWDPGNPQVRPGGEWREVALIPMSSMRHSFLVNADLLQYCQGENVKCEVLHCGELWEEKDVKVRILKRGDYLIVRVRPATERTRTCRTNEISTATEDSYHDARDGDENEDLDDTTALFMVMRTLNGQISSAATHARVRLPPPGNGPVTFSKWTLIKAAGMHLSKTFALPGMLKLLTILL